MSAADVDLKDVREEFDYDRNNWQSIRDAAAIDIQYVAGNPWTEDDLKQRANRPTVAPEEMGQYFNQVINQLRLNPRGMKFSPVGGGASEAGARFYQNKAREIEYRSNASIAYIQAAENAIQRSYGFVRITRKYASPTSANQELWIEGFPNPNMVMPDSDALRPDSSDMTRCWVFRWMPQSEFKRAYPSATVTSFSSYSTVAPAWVKGNQILVAERWWIANTSSTLHLIRVNGQESQVLAADLEKMRTQAPGTFEYARELRPVELPKVRMVMTNGLEELGDVHDWPGKYIPIVSCYGKVLYTERDQAMTREILSMTRFGRATWKSYCYACSQQLEVLGMTPKAPLGMYRGQMNPAELGNLAKSMHEPVAALTYGFTAEGAAPGQNLPPPMRIDYPAAQHLQALEIVIEGWRRKIQASMGSNFLPTQAQRRNEKSGVALDKIEQSASTGTFHFVDNYNHMIRQVGVIVEDLITPIHDYMGVTGVIEADGKAASQRINDPNDPKAVNTKGDYLVTVSEGQSSDSQREAAQDFTEQLVSNIALIAQVAGPKPAAAILSRSIKMRLNSPEGDQIAEILEPPEYKSKEGQPPATPREMGMQQEIQKLQAMLQKAAQDHQAKVVEQQGKMAITQEQEKHEDYRASLDREVKLAVAAITAQAKQVLQDQALFYEERSRVGAQLHDQAMGNRDTAKNIHLATLDATEAAHDRVHDLNIAGLDHAHALDAGQQAAALTPQPEAGI